MENYLAFDRPYIPAIPNKKAEEKPLKVPRRLQQYLLKYEDYDLEQKIGCGSFGNVWKARNKNTNEITALKVLTKTELRPKELQRFFTEVQLLVKCRSRFVVPIMGFTTSYPYCIATMLAKRGNLYNLLAEQRKKNSVPGTSFMKIAIGIASGMTLLHSYGIIHRDLKPSNILLTEEALPLICDFGISRKDDGSKMTKMAGTPSWMSPEVIDGNDYSLSADVFSFGMILYEMATLRKPYPNMEPVDIVKAISFGTRPPIPGTVPAGMKTLIERCWDGNPSQRPLFSEILSDLTSFRACFNNCRPQKLTDFVKSLEQQSIKMIRASSTDNLAANAKEKPATTGHPVSGRAISLPNITIESCLKNPEIIDNFSIDKFLILAKNEFSNEENTKNWEQILQVIHKLAKDDGFGDHIVASNIIMCLPIKSFTEECSKIIMLIAEKTEKKSTDKIVDAVTNVIDADASLGLNIINYVSQKNILSSVMKLLITKKDKFLTKENISLYLKLLISYLKSNPDICVEAQNIFTHVLKVENKNDEEENEDDSFNSIRNDVTIKAYKGLSLTSSISKGTEGPDIHLNQVIRHLMTPEIQESAIEFLKSVDGFPTNSKTIRAMLKAAENQKDAASFLISMIENGGDGSSYLIEHTKWLKKNLPDQESTLKIFIAVAKKHKKQASKISGLATLLERFAEETPELTIECIKCLSKETIENNEDLLKEYKFSPLISTVFINFNSKKTQKIESKRSSLAFITDYKYFIGKNFENCIPIFVSLMKEEEIQRETFNALYDLCSIKKCRKILNKSTIDDAARELWRNRGLRDVIAKFIEAL